MARLARLAIDGALHHVALRGHDGRPVVADDADRARLLGVVGAHAAAHRVALHAYLVMEGGVELLLTPPEGADLPRYMQAIGRSYVRYFNDRHHRRGTLWEGRYRSTVLQADRFLFDAMANFDLRPVQAGLVERAQDFAWSSHQHYAGLQHDRALTPHALIWSLGNTPFARESAYRDLVERGISAERSVELDRAFDSGWALGDDAFLTQLQSTTGRRLSPALPGRPRQN